MTALPVTADLKGVVEHLVEVLAADGARDHPLDQWAERLCGHASLEHFDGGDVLVERHAAADGLRFLLDGRVHYDHLLDDRHDEIAAEQVPWMALGWSGLASGRYRATAVADSDGTMLTLSSTACGELSHRFPILWAHISDLVLRTSTHLLWEARGRRPHPSPSTAPPGADLLHWPAPGRAALDEMLQQATSFSALPDACRRWLAEHSVVYWAPAGTRVIDEAQASSGLWFLYEGRVALTATVTHDGRKVVRGAVRPGSLLCWSSVTGQLAAPYDVEAQRDSTFVVVPRSALTDLLRQHPTWAAAVCARQLGPVRTALVSTRVHRGGRATDGGISALTRLVEDSTPQLPVNSEVYGVPPLLGNHLTHADGFDRLYRLYFQGTETERTVAGLSLDLLADLERAQRWVAGIQATYAAVVRNRHLPAVELRRLSSRWFRGALTHMPYVIKGWEHLPDDPNCIFIYNHMAYASESILANGFLFNPDSHFLSSIILEDRYGDGIRVSRTNAATEFWRADYYDPLGHIPVTTPESGWRDETPQEKQQRKDQFFDDCAAVLAGGQPFAIAPEGTITAEESATERSPGPLRPGAFLMSARLPSRPKIVPVALANFDKPPPEAVFSCVIAPPFTMEERGVDVEDRHAMDAFLTSYRQEFRGYVEEAVDLARTVREPGADLDGLVTNVDRVDEVHRDFEHDVRALEHPVQHASTGRTTTALYGSSTIREWDTFAEDLGVPDAVNLGFGGSTLEACRAYFTRVVLPYQPTRLVVYGGDNDIGRGAAPEQVAGHFGALADLVDAFLPSTRCWFVSIKPSPARREQLSAVEQTNTAIRAEISRRDRWRYVNWFRYLLDVRGRPNAQLFERDLLHVNTAGYALLAHLLRRELRDAPRAAGDRLTDGSTRELSNAVR